MKNYVSIEYHRGIIFSIKKLETFRFSEKYYKTNREEGWFLSMSNDKRSWINVKLI